jgi:hypothetical protein
VKKAESSLTAYIQHANGPADEGNRLAPSGDSVVDNATDRPANRIKRRRLHSSDDIESDVNNKSDVASEILSNARLGADDEDAESKKKKMITDLTTRIRTALKKQFPTEKKRESKRKKLLKQAECTDVALLDSNARSQHPSQTDLTVVISEFSARHARGESTVVDQFSYWEALLREKASEITKDAHGIGWKYRFIAACVRKIRDSMPAVHLDTSAVCDNSNPTRFTLRRWEISAWIVNSIVDGLWEAWGSQAALVYDALAC